MNITETFRRKNKYHKPIIVFKQLYRDYYRQSPKSPELTQKKYRISEGTLGQSPKYAKQNMTVQEELKKLSHDLTYKNPDERKCHANISRTSSTQDMTKYLLKHGENIPGRFRGSMNTSKDDGDGDRSFGRDSSMMGQETTLRRSKSTNNHNNSTFVFRLLERSQMEDKQKDKQSYFKNTYTANHPFFRMGNKLQQKKSDNQQQQQQKEIPKILPDIFKEVNGQKLKLPSERRADLEELKMKIKARKVMVKDCASKIRHDYIIKNVHTQKEDKFRAVTETKRLLGRTAQNSTKENIFPTVG